MDNLAANEEGKTRRMLTVATELRIFAKENADFDPWTENMIHRTAALIQNRASMSPTLKKTKIVAFIKSHPDGFVSRQDVIDHFEWPKPAVCELVNEMLDERPPRIEEFRLDSSGPTERGRPAMRLRLAKR